MNESTNPDPNQDQDQGTPVPPTSQAPDCLSCEFRKKALEYATEPKADQPSGGTRKARLIDEIRRLQIPARCKAELALLCARAKKLGKHILSLLKRHRHLGEAAVLGSIICYALCFIPWIGGFLGLVALGMSVASGVLRELREDLAALFTAETTYA
jgi:hypothetical protein